MSAEITTMLLLVAAILSIGIYYKWYDKPFNSKSKSQITLLSISAIFFIAISTMIFIEIYEPSNSYPFTAAVNRYNAYEQQFDAFLKGQLNIDYPVSEELLGLSNPYNRAERDAANVFYLWDRAMYNGNYYSYFGAAPILTVYFPFYFITGKVASASVVCYILSIITITAIAFLTVKAAKLFCKKVNFFLLFIALFAVEFGSLLFMLLVSADMYYIAVLSGLCNLALFLLFTVCAKGSTKTTIKYIDCFLAGLFLVLAAMSRPNMAVLGLIAIPLYLNIFKDKQLSLGKKAMQIISFAVPVIIGSAAQMWYNNARFSSPFDFGLDYQLTVTDISQYAVTGLLFLPAMYHYFLQAPELKSYFPYFHLSFDSYKGYYSGFFYNTRTIGALFFPSVWGFFISPYLIYKKNLLWKKCFYILSIALPLAIAFLDTCLGGVNIRYLADILFILVFAGTIILLDFYSNFDSAKRLVKIIIFVAITLVFIATAIMGAILILENERYSFFTK